jgi:hypothetical protein
MVELKVQRAWSQGNKIIMPLAANATDLKGILPRFELDKNRMFHFEDDHARAIAPRQLRAWVQQGRGALC